MKLTDYEQKLKAKNKTLIVLICVFGFMIAVKIVGVALYAKGVSVPRLIDILL